MISSRAAHVSCRMRHRRYLGCVNAHSLVLYTVFGDSHYRVYSDAIPSKDPSRTKNASLLVCRAVIGQMNRHSF